MDEALRRTRPGDRLRRWPGFSYLSVGSGGERTAARPGRYDSRLRLTGRLAWPWLGYGGSIALVAGLYFGAALAGSAVKLTGNVEIVWPPVGIGIAALYLGGLKLWPGVLIGDLLADIPGHLPVGSSLGQTAGNMLEVIVATLLLRRLASGRSPLDRAGGVVRMVGAIAAGTAISATVGMTSLRLGGVISTDEAPRLWRTWFLGDTCGALMIVPLALAWYGASARRARRRWGVEAFVLVGLVAVLAELTLRSTNSDDLLYVVFPALIWVALRLGPRGGTLAVAVTITLVVRETAQRRGPFVMHSITREVLTTQLFIATAAFSTLVFAAIVSERERLAKGLAASRERLLRAGQEERKRLERNLHDGAQQRLSAVAVSLQGLATASKIWPRWPHDAAVKAASDELRVAIEELRELAHGLHPTELSDFGLEHAIENMAARSSVLVRVRVSLPDARLGQLAESTAYYVIAEALTNAQRHSGATAVETGASVSGESLHVYVLDNGRGIARVASGSGLEGLRDRVETVGGTFTLDSVPGRGTIVSATLPLSRD
jgi:signal transduction histidine kinase